MIRQCSAPSSAQSQFHRSEARPTAYVQRECLADASTTRRVGSRRIRLVRAVRRSLASLPRTAAHHRHPQLNQSDPAACTARSHPHSCNVYQGCVVRPARLRRAQWSSPASASGVANCGTATRARSAPPPPSSSHSATPRCGSPTPAATCSARCARSSTRPPPSSPPPAS